MLVFKRGVSATRLWDSACGEGAEPKSGQNQGEQRRGGKDGVEEMNEDERVGMWFRSTPWHTSLEGSSEVNQRRQQKTSLKHELGEQTRGL